MKIKTLIDLAETQNKSLFEVFVNECTQSTPEPKTQFTTAELMKIAFEQLKKDRQSVPEPKPKAKPQKAIAYNRVSSKQQTRGNGIQNQSLRISQMAALSNKEIVMQATEIGSAYNDVERPTLIETLQYAKEINAVVIFASTDRLSRNFIKGMELLKNNDILCCDNYPYAKAKAMQLLSKAETEIKKRIRINKAKAKRA
jgi:hypothetical protein